VAVIASAKARDRDGDMRAFVARALPEANEEDVDQAAQVALEIIESVPVFLARAHQEAEERGLDRTVLPLLERAERYFLKPIDILPEMTYGLPGLLDDAYLVLRILQALDRGPKPFLDWDLEAPTRFLRRLLGRDMATRLDTIAARALGDLSERLEALWERTAHRA
jgi:hypothetical protein